MTGLVAVDPSTLAVRWSMRYINGLRNRPAVNARHCRGSNLYGFAHISPLGWRLRWTRLRRYSRIIVQPLILSPALSLPVSARHPYAVHAWSWVPSGVGQGAVAGGALVPLGPVAACGEDRIARPLAVMPPAPGKRTSHLIVGTMYSSRSCVCCRCPASPSCTRTG